MIDPHDVPVRFTAKALDLFARARAGHEDGSEFSVSSCQHCRDLWEAEASVVQSRNEGES